MCYCLCYRNTFIWQAMLPTLKRLLWMNLHHSCQDTVIADPFTGIQPSVINTVVSQLMWLFILSIFLLKTVWNIKMKIYKVIGPLNVLTIAWIFTISQIKWLEVCLSVLSTAFFYAPPIHILFVPILSLAYRKCTYFKKTLDFKTLDQ